MLIGLSVDRLAGRSGWKVCSFKLLNDAASVEGKSWPEGGVSTMGCEMILALLSSGSLE